MFSIRNSIRALGGALVCASALSFSMPASAETTLRVFGPSSLDQLASRLPPEEQQKIQKAVIAGFIKANPDVISVVWDAQGPQSGALQRMMTAKLGGEEIDLISCTANLTNGAYVRRGLLKPITTEIAPIKDRFDAAGIGAYTVDGQIYGAPVSVMSTSAFYYNVNLFTKLGITPPKTYAEMMEASKKISAAGVIPVLHQGSNALLWPMWFFETLAQTSGDVIGKTSTNLAGKTKFNDPAEVQAFALIKKWVDDGVLSKDSLSVDQDGMRAAFASGKSAMYYGGTWELPSLVQNVKNFKWGVFAFPKMEGTPGEPRHGGGASRGLCISADIPAAKMDAAMRFIKYVTEPDVAKSYLENEAPVGSSIKGVPVVEADYAKQLRADVFPETVKFLDWIWPTEITVATASAVAGVVGGTMTPQAAADSIQQVFDGLVADGKWTIK